MAEKKAYKRQIESTTLMPVDSEEGLLVIHPQTDLLTVKCHREHSLLLKTNMGLSIVLVPFPPTHPPALDRDIVPRPILLLGFIKTLACLTRAQLFRPTFSVLFSHCQGLRRDKGT